MDKVTVFLPCRKGSERVKNKNTRAFGDVEGGLIYIKLSQLLKVDAVEQIVVSTNDDEVKRIAGSFASSKILIDHRADLLSSSATSTDDLIKYVPTLIKSATVLWTHVTSPFVDEKIYQNAIESYFSNLKDHDSLMSVTKIQKFLWDEKGPINYDATVEKWPRTQTIKPLYEINSGIFIADIDTFIEHNDRIGTRPLLYELDEKRAFDIDWEVDFEFAEILWAKHGKI